MDITPLFLKEYYTAMARQEVPDERLPALAASVGAILDRMASKQEPGPWVAGPAAVFDPANPSWWGDLKPGRLPIGDEPGGDPEPGPLPADVPGLLSADSQTIARALAGRAVSARQLAETCLQLVEQWNPHLNAFVTVTAEQMLEAADRLDIALAAGAHVGPLAAVPVGLKDLFDTAGVCTAGGSLIFKDRIPETSAYTVRRLARAGALFAGKTNTHEFAFGATTNNPHYGPTRNPWDLSRIPGGSSGGSSAAVAARVLPVSMGTDTGGSVRMPAALTGIVGLKPTYGLVSRQGVLPLSWSLDHPGPLTLHAIDAALVLDVIAGHDPADPATRRRDLPSFTAQARAGLGGLRGLRVGVAEDWMATRVVPGVRDAVMAAIRRLEDLGAEVEPVTLPSLDDMVLVNRLLALPEAASIHAPFLRDRADEYGDDVRMRMELGLAVPARDYIIACGYRGEMVRQVAEVMQSVDLLALPSTPITAPAVGAERVDWDPAGSETVAEALIRFTAPFNVTGQPAISVPCGQVDGLPVGLQLVGRPLEDGLVVAAAVALQTAWDWTCQRPSSPR